MKFAIIADVHANLEAFKAVLEDSKQQECSHYAFLGDFVGYCADPKACIDIVRAMNAPCVKGNHDEYCSTDLPLNGFNPKAAKAVQWTREQLTEEDRRWLHSLGYVRTVENFTIVRLESGSNLQMSGGCVVFWPRAPNEYPCKTLPFSNRLAGTSTRRTPSTAPLMISLLN